MLIINTIITDLPGAWKMVEDFETARKRKPIAFKLKEIETMEQMSVIVQAIGYEVRPEKLPDRKRWHMTYRATGEQLFVDEFAGQEAKAIAEIEQACGILNEPVPQNDDEIP